MSESSASKKPFSLEDAYTSVAYPKGPLLLVWTERAEHAAHRDSHEQVWTKDLLLSHLPAILSIPGASAKMGLGTKSRVIHAAAELSVRTPMPGGLYEALYDFAHEAGSPILSAGKLPGLDPRVIEKYLSGLARLAVAENVPAQSSGVPANEIRMKFIEDLIVCSETIARHNPGLLFSSASIPFVERLASLLASASRKESDMALKTQAVRALSRLYSALQPQAEPKKAKLSPKAEDLLEFTLEDLAGTLEEMFLENAQNAHQKKIGELKTQIKDFETRIKATQASLDALKKEEREAEREMFSEMSEYSLESPSYQSVLQLKDFARRNRYYEHIIEVDIQSLRDCKERLNSVRCETGSVELKFSSETLCAAIVQCFAVKGAAAGKASSELPDIDLLLSHVERYYNYVQGFGFLPVRTQKCPFERSEGDELSRSYSAQRRSIAIDSGMPLAELFLSAGYPRRLFEPVAPPEFKNPMQDRAIECVEEALFKNYGQTKAILEQLASADYAAKTNGNANEQAIHAKTLGMLAKNPVFAVSNGQAPELKLVEAPVEAGKQVLGGKSVYSAKNGDKIDLNNIPGWKPKPKSNQNCSRSRFGRTSRW